MAITDNQAIMVIHQEGMTSALAPPTSSPHSLFVVLKPLHSGGGGPDEGAPLANKDISPVGTSSVGFQKLSSISLSSVAGANSKNQLWNLPAEITCKGITVTLDNNNMWNEFYRCQTEMILTKQGRRMFPCCRFRISGLEPFQRYTLVMDMDPVDNHRYKWSDRRWETNGKADPHISRSFVHPESPATGLDWMQNPVSFYKLKLTNNPLDQDNHIIINSMHRYLPRLHIIPADKTTDVIQLNGPDVITFSFPQTKFFAVTAYQNLCITQLKIDYNPFAKGFRDDANNSRTGKPKNGLSTETMESEAKPSRETTTLNNLKTLFAKRNAADKALKGQLLPFPADEDHKVVSGDAPTDLEKSSSKKRPLEEGLSELIKGAHVNVKRISLEKVPDGSDQQTNTICLLDEERMITASDHGEKENVSIADDEEVMGEKDKLKNDCGINDVNNVSEVEGPVNSNVLLNSKCPDLPTVKHTVESCSKTSSMQVNSSNAPATEMVDTALNETALNTGDEETPQTVGKPLDSGEGKKKRAEPVPLPLLALFLQQLKSKTRPARPKSKCEISSSPLQSEKSCQTTTVAENTSPSTASLSHTVTTQSDVQSAASPMSRLFTPSILTCPVDNTTVSPCLSPLTTSTSPTASSTLIDTSAPSLVHTDLNQSPDPEQKETPTLDSDDNILTASTTNITSNTMLVSEQEAEPVISSSLADKTVPDSVIVSITLDTDISDVLADAPCALLTSSIPKAELESIFDGPKSEVVCSDVNTPESTADSALDSCIVPCAEFVPEASNQSTFSEGNANVPSSPSSPRFSVPSPASSPDPFPPGLFCDRPIPPRKSLDSFPQRLLFDRPRSTVDLLEPVPETFFFTKPECPRDLHYKSKAVGPQLTSPMPPPEPCISKETEQPVLESKSKKSKVKHKKGGKLKPSDGEVTSEVTEGPIPIPMQPSLEDVEGQLFVSFISKKALEIHLGDEATEEALEKTTVNIHGENHESIEERIEALEKVLLHDLNMVKYRQVIHPVLQAVGLKLNLLDLTLAIDLQYLGVCLPIPPPVPLNGESSESSVTSQVPFVSRTGKTSDVTKIKGWRDKFSTSNSLHGVGSSSDAPQKNLSAFCSDMLDEYLESEGKLIDERAASFSQAFATPVAYQLPTKSTSYVRTLDSVLKKQTPSPTATTLENPLTSRNPTKTSKSKELGRLGRNASKKFFRYGLPKTPSSTVRPSVRSSKEVLKTRENFQKRSTKSGICKTKTKKGSKASQASLPTEGRAAVKSMSMSTVGQDSTSGSTGSAAAMRLSKTVVKLLDVEDGAVWEGKRRTCITEERATIALSSLVTAGDKTKGCSSTIVKRRAPPCLNDFCRLGCVCTSLAQERRQHHCGKPQCMLGCDCLRRKVVLLRHATRNEHAEGQGASEKEPDEKGTDMVKKKKRKKAYILSGPEVAPEPAAYVKRLWDCENNYNDSESVFIPTPAKPHCPPVFSPELPQDLENILHPTSSKVQFIKTVRCIQTHTGGLGTIRRVKGSLQTCARVRPFCQKSPPKADQQGAKEDQHLCPEDSVAAEMEEGELRPPALFGPTKRLEIVSKCKWATAGSRNVVLRVVCERMAQDRLKHPFWVGKYQIQPISKLAQENDEGSTITYKISISQPHLVKNSQKSTKIELMKQLEAQLIKTIGKSEVKGLPLLSHVTPAGLLKAEKKPPGAAGHITVNGKPYPQAKLELGQMGALHPANRLAAYITGRVCLGNQNASKTETTAKTLTTSPTTSTITAATSTTAVATSSLTSTPSSTVISVVKPIVAKPSVGKVFTQVAINPHQPKLPSNSAPRLLSTIKNLIKPSSSATGVTGISVSSNTPSNAGVASQKPAASDLTVGTTQVNAVPGSSSTASVKTAMIPTAGSHTVIPGGGVTLMQPATSVQPSVPGQKMVFQMLKTANGSTLYRNPNGQLVQLVPLNQFRALNPNVLLPKQTTIVRLPSTSTVKPQDGSSSNAIASIPATSTLLLKAQNPTPVHSTATLSLTKPVSSVAEKTVESAKLSQASTVGVVPSFGNTRSGIAKIVPQTSTQGSSNLGPSKGGLSLITPQSSLTTQNQGSLEVKPDHNAHITPALAEGSELNIRSSSGSKKKPVESVVLKDHCYTFEAKKTTTASDHGDEPKEGTNSTDACSPKMPLEDGLEFAPIEDDESETDETLGFGIVGKTEAELDLGEDESDSELTEDSDMYASDQEDLHIDTDSNRREKWKQRSLKDLKENEGDELVDIETYEEKNTLLKEQGSLKDNYKVLCRKQKMKEQEMERRVCLNERFHNLRLTLNHDDSKASKMTVLKLALEEIHTLTKQSDELIKLEKELQRKSAYYLQIASLLSGKTQKSISQKLSEIIAKQKSLESRDRTKRTTEPVPKPTLIDSSTKRKRLQSKENGEDDLHRRIQLSPNSSAVEPSVPRQKRRNAKQKVSETQKKGKESIWSQSAKPKSLREKHLPTALLRRERTRPNILSRKKSQSSSERVSVPQIIPLVETVVPCNQIITINNPLQPITTLGKRQSSTPGVAAVSISVPAISHPIRLENPVLQPQALSLANNSPLKTNVSGKTVDVPKISGVVSLVPSEKLVTPPAPQKTDIPLVESQGVSDPVGLEAQEKVLSNSSKGPSAMEAQSLDKQLVEDVLTQHEQGAKISMAETTARQKEERKDGANSEAEVENLMSLLDELDFLNQQLNSESSHPEGDLSDTKTSNVLTDLLTKKEAGVDRDDERSLSPLFLRLDEDLIASTTSKDELDDIPPKVDDLVKVIFGSDSPPNSSESDVAAGVDDGGHGAAGRAKSDAPSPPPLLQMIAGGATSADTLKEQVSVSWRPMPKLAPLGLKTQDSVQNKTTSLHISKPGSQLPSLRSTHM